MLKVVQDKINTCGRIIGDDILKVDSFVNHQIDVSLMRQIGKYYASEFENVDKILTIETSGIAIAMAAAMAMNDIPVLFAKKAKSKIVDENVYKTDVYSFTKGNFSTVSVSKDYLKKGERILIVDDFLADGNASFGLIDLCKQAGAEVLGVCVVIDKAFQAGRKKLTEANIKLVSCASVAEFKDGKVVFANY